MPGRLRILILVALIIIIGAIAAVFLLSGNSDEGNQSASQPAAQVAQNNNGGPIVPTDVPVTPIPTQELVDIVVAVQSIARGSVIAPNAVRLQPWPLEAAPFNAVSSLEDVIGKIARTDLYVEQPILTSYVIDNLSDIAASGSDIAALIPPGEVAVALPMDRITSVAYAVRPGDRVDVVVSLLYVDIDEEFQSLLPNNVNLVNPTADESSIQLNIGEEVSGRFESVRIPLAIFNSTTFTTSTVPVDWPVIVRPSEGVRPRLVTQRTVQDALVLNVGNNPLDGRLNLSFTDIPTPTPIVVEEQPRGSAQQQAAGTVPTAVPTSIPVPDIVTLSVSAQEAVMLTWMIEARIPITFLLRSASDTSQVPTTPVTLDYIMSEYNISVPVKQDFAIQPAIRSIRQTIVDSSISLDN